MSHLVQTTANTTRQPLFSTILMRLRRGDFVWNLARGGLCGVIRAKGVEFKMVYCPARTFWMGTDDGPETERPRHRVAIFALLCIS